MTTRNTVLHTALVGAAFLMAAPAFADATYLDRFEGSFDGSGFIQREQDSSPRSVKCSVEGSKPSTNALSISGSCRAAIIVRREIGADIRYDAGSDRFAGSYTGSTKGTAKLSNGRLRGGTLTLDLTYPTPVHGDLKAVMTIRNTGNGTFSFSVVDQVDGQPKETSDVTLSKG